MTEGSTKRDQRSDDEAVDGGGDTEDEVDAAERHGAAGEDLVDPVLLRLAVDDEHHRRGEDEDDEATSERGGDVKDLADLGHENAEDGEGQDDPAHDHARAPHRRPAVAPEDRLERHPRPVAGRRIVANHQEDHRDVGQLQIHLILGQDRDRLQHVRVDLVGEGEVAEVHDQVVQKDQDQRVQNDHDVELRLAAALQLAVQERGAEVPAHRHLKQRKRRNRSHRKLPRHRLRLQRVLVHREEVRDNPSDIDLTENHNISCPLHKIQIFENGNREDTKRHDRKGQQRPLHEVLLVVTRHPPKHIISQRNRIRCQ